MKSLIMTLALTIPFAAMANNELNSPDVVAQQQTGVQAPDPSAKTVIIKFDKHGTPLAVAHIGQDKVSTKDLDKLAFAQIVVSAEEPNSLANSTPSTEQKNAQGTPQWGFYGGRGAIIRGPNGGFIAAGRRYGGYGGYRGGYGYSGGYGYAGGGYVGGDYGYATAGYAGGWGGYGWNTGYNSGWGSCGWGGCGGGCQTCGAPVYMYSGCVYRPVAYYGGGWGGYTDGGDDFYAAYQPSYYY
jgi:hypothetical protein